MEPNFSVSEGEAAEAVRLQRLDKLFRARFGRAPRRYFSSPGRIEVVGNHTDHNCGKVLVGAVSCDIAAAVAARADGVVQIAAEGFGLVRVRTDELAPRAEERGKSAALVRGVLRAIADAGYAVGGFSAATHSNIFRGAGLSSSAAFEVLVAEIVNCLYAKGRISALQKARFGQYAENVYFGKPCGLLDQTGIALGGLHTADFAQPDAPQIGRVPWPAGYSVVVINTGGSHAKLTQHYAAIREEMCAVAAYFGCKTLREVSKERVWEEMARLRRATSDRAVLRALHYFDENARVDAAAAALKQGDTAAFLRAVRDSGESSVRFLQNCCVPGKVEQPVLLALRLSERLLKGEGAFRMQGGGFAGTVFAVVPCGQAERYARGMADVFGRQNIFITGIRQAGACETGNQPRKRREE